MLPLPASPGTAELPTWVVGGSARPAGGDQSDQPLGDLGGTRVGLVDLHQSPGVAPDRRIGSGGPEVPSTDGGIARAMFRVAVGP
jgi:hypothetical protein